MNEKILNNQLDGFDDWHLIMCNFSCVDFVRKGLNIDEDILGPGDFPCLVHVVLILTYVNWLFCPSLLLILWAFSQPQVQYIWKHFWIMYQEEFLEWKAFGRDLQF